jgi:DNA-binding transcriptional ArsR family regulator
MDASSGGTAFSAVGDPDWREASGVSAPLYQLKAEFFKTLGHPVRIRVLELLSEGERSVAEMLPEVGIEASHFSQQLAVLRRANLVVTRKEGSTVYYSLTSPHVAELLRVARTILSGVLAGQAELLADLRATSSEGEPPGRAPS